MVAPAADGVVVLQTEAERVHVAVAGRAHRVGAMLLELLAQRPRRPPPAASSSGGTSGGGGGGGVPRIFCRTYLPRITGEVRVG